MATQESRAISISYDCLGRCASKRGQTRKAVELFTKAVTISSTVNGSAHPITCEYRMHLASHLALLCRYAEAIAQHELAFKGYSETFGRLHTHTLTAASTLAFTYNQGQLDVITCTLVLLTPCLRSGGFKERALETYRDALNISISLNGEINATTAAIRRSIQALEAE
jgi:hypothetical protein